SLGVRFTPTSAVLSRSPPVPLLLPPPALHPHASHRLLPPVPATPVAPTSRSPSTASPPSVHTPPAPCTPVISPLRAHATAPPRHPLPPPPLLPASRHKCSRPPAASP